jgi:hypothetical protein
MSRPRTLLLATVVCAVVASIVLLRVAEPTRTLAAAAPITLPPDADAPVKEATATTNYATDNLRADGGTDPDVDSYLRFTVPPGSGPVQSATLRVFAFTGTVDGPSLYTTSTTWSETGITWNTRPARTSAALAKKGAIAANTWVEFNVTPVVTGAGSYGFVLATTSTDGIDLYSKEAAATANRPQLVVTFADATPDTTPPAAPTGLTATASSATVTLDWADNTEADLASYRVFRQNADGTWPTTPTGTTTLSAFTEGGLANGTTYTYRVTAVDTAGNQSPPSATASATPTAATPPPPPPPPPAGTSHVVTAAGDHTSCQGATACNASNARKVRDAVVAQNPEIHLAIGDFQYQDIGTIASGYDLLFTKGSAFWSKIRPTPGPTHDVTSCTDTRYQTYWGRAAMKMYSFDVGAWHIISLPSAAVRYGCDVAGITAALKADLAASAKQCTLAFWQDPYFTRPTATHGAEAGVKPWVDALFAANADVLVQASNHDYQRFAEQDPNRVAAPGRGLRAFVVGTAGIGLYTFAGTAPNIEASNDTTWGVLRLNLNDDGTYTGTFIPAAGGTFSDSFSGRCH